MTLTPEDRAAITEYRIERSHKVFEEAQYVANGGFWNLAANRLYYSAFYMCEALLLKNRITTNSHAGVSRMINLHFIRTGKLDMADGRLLGNLFRMRQTGDYDDLSDWSEDEIRPIFPQVQNLLIKIEKLINE